jgi:DNA polymerase-4
MIFFKLARVIRGVEDIRDRRFLDRVLAEEVFDLAAELSSEGLTSKTVTVKIRFSNFETHTHEVTLSQATDEPRILLEAAPDCLSRFEFKQRVRLLGVHFGQLDKVGGGNHG